MKEEVKGLQESFFSPNRAVLELGFNILDLGLVDVEQLQEAIKLKEEKKYSLAKALLDLGYISKNDAYNVLELEYGLSSINLKEHKPKETALQSLPLEMVKNFEVVPVDIDDSTIFVATSHPNDVMAIDYIKSFTKRNVRVLLAFRDDIEQAIETYYNKDRALKEYFADFSAKDSAEKKGLEAVKTDKELKELKDLKLFEEQITEKELEEKLELTAEESSPIIRLVNVIIQQAIMQGSSDIHLEVSDKRLLIRYRKDGILHNIQELNPSLIPAVISRIKIMANLDIAEKRIPQDGRIKFDFEKEDIDLRISLLPTIFGEKVVIRILRKTSLFSLDELGFSEEDLKRYYSIVKRPYGMGLVTGPTGSGKTTTLYATLNTIKSSEVNVLTIEDPIEYQIDGINQVQVNSKVNLTFASALRSFLRQDPDIILVGEIRDKETAEIAIQASITGHLVLSTLHTNDAASSLTRLIDMGIEPFMVTSSVTGVVAQRLVRRICPNCITRRTDVQNSWKELFVKKEGFDPVFYYGKGCEACLYTGYKGRAAIYEIMPVTEEISRAIIKAPDLKVIAQIAKNQGMKTLRESALTKVTQGITTIEEVFRVTIEE